uniref:Putative secreted protein n=1 Tax=Ixodes ricinus TaxID=34613 RepID=A0A6B0U3G5_IXORI
MCSMTIVACALTASTFAFARSPALEHNKTSCETAYLFVRVNIARNLRKIKTKRDLCIYCQLLSSELRHCFPNVN